MNAYFNYARTERAE